MLWLSWYGYSNFVELETKVERAVDMGYLEGQIQYFDEVATMSARLWALTGDTHWEERYQEFSIAFENAVQEALVLVPAIEGLALTQRIDESKAQLIMLEYEAFDWIRQGQLAQAEKILFSQDYIKEKQKIKRNTRKLYQLLKTALETKFIVEKQWAFTHIVIVFILIVVLLIFWFYMLKRLHHWHVAVNEHRQQLRQQTQALQASEAQISAILNNMIDAVIVIDESGRIESVNQAVKTVFGYEPIELIGQSVNLLIPEPHQNQHDNYMQHYLTHGECKIIGLGREGLALHQQGHTFAIDLTVSEMYLGERRLFNGLIRDISTRVRVENQLKETLALQQAILDSANYTIISTDLEGTIRIFNTAAERLLGYHAQEVVGQRTPVAFHDPDELKQRNLLLRQQLGESIPLGFATLIAKVQRGWVDEYECSYLTQAGLWVPMMLSMTALHDDDEHITGYLCIGIDITERRKIDQLKNEFISTVSHELRTPLTSIRGSLGLVTGGAMGELPAKIKPLLEIANKNSERLVRLINDILDIEKIEAGKMEFVVKPLPIIPLIEQAIQANKGFAEQLGIELVFQPQVANLIASVDPDRFEQVMTNLISNACKFSPAGTQVNILLADCGEWLQVSVADQGQ
ncbi:MAG: PAS domain S-box protein, partial [Pseudomonadota bacterium]|nr:PAS domain S-box protein [Pseudomonadota bacterium]